METEKKKISEQIEILMKAIHHDPRCPLMWRQRYPSLVQSSEINLLWKLFN